MERREAARKESRRVRFVGGTRIDFLEERSQKMARRIPIRHAKLDYSISSNARLRDERGVFRHGFPQPELSAVRHSRNRACRRSFIKSH